MFMGNLYIHVTIRQQCQQTTGYSPDIRVTRKLKFWKQSMSNENRQIIIFSKCFIILYDCKEVLFLKKSLKVKEIKLEIKNRGH